MPIYEFRCNSCHGKASFFLKKMDTPIIPSCPFCGSDDVARSISSFAFHKSENTRREESTAGSPDYYNDPRNIGRWTEGKAKKLGLKLPSQVQQMIAAARDGELPEPVKNL